MTGKDWIVIQVIISDFDGCILKEKGNHIEAMVSKTIIEMNKQIPVIIVTARATAKSIKEAKEMLLKAELSHIPIFFRDMNVHDNSPSGLIAYKGSSSVSLSPIPIIGTTCSWDNDVIIEAYHLTNVRHIIRIRWEESVHIPVQSHVINVEEDNLGEVWCEIKKYVEMMGDLHELRRA